jgi:exoribonuclease-2
MRVVKTPERWPRIAELAAKQGGQVSSDLDSKALNDFLIQRKATDPDHLLTIHWRSSNLWGMASISLSAPETRNKGISASPYRITRARGLPIVASLISLPRD